MSFAVIKVRSSINVRKNIKDTMKMLHLTRINHCVIIPETKDYKGMLQKAKDYITWGEIEDNVLEELIIKRGKLVGDNPITDDYIKNNTQYADIKELSKGLINEEIKYKDIKDVKPLFRLHPPIKGYEGIKRTFVVKGALGYRGNEINKLIRRMV